TYAYSAASILKILSAEINTSYRPSGNFYLNDNIDYKIEVSTGIIKDLTHNEILLLLTAKNKDKTGKNLSLENIWEKGENFVLYININFATKLVFKKLYTHLNKKFISELLDKGVEVVITS